MKLFENGTMDAENYECFQVAMFDALNGASLRNFIDGGVRALLKFKNDRDETIGFMWPSRSNDARLDITNSGYGITIRATLRVWCLNKAKELGCFQTPVFEQKLTYEELDQLDAERLHDLLIGICVAAEKQHKADVDDLRVEWVQPTEVELAVRRDAWLPAREKEHASGDC